MISTKDTLKYISPNEIVFEKEANDKVYLSDSLYTSMLYLNEMPNEISLGWDKIIERELNRLSNTDNQIKIDVKHIPLIKANKMLNTDKKNMSANYDERLAGSGSQRREYHEKEQMATEIDREEYNLVQMIYRIYFTDTNEANLIKNVELFKNVMESKNFKFSYQLYNNKANYSAKFVNISSQENSILKFEKPLIIPSNVLGLMYYNHGNDFYDPYGLYLGDSGTKRIYFNPFQESSNRASTSLSIFGETGAGKSTLLKNMLLQQVQVGNKATVIDYEGDFKAFTLYLNGKLFDLSTDRFNIFQLQIVGGNEDTFLTNQELLDNSIANQIDFLAYFFKILVPDLLNNESNKTLNRFIENKVRSVLKKFYYEEMDLTTFEKYYNKRPEEYKTLEDFIAFAEEELKAFKNNVETTEEMEDLRRFGMFIDTLNQPNTLNYLNSTSTVDFSTETMLTFNMSSLSSVKNEELKVAIMFYFVHIYESRLFENRQNNGKWKNMEDGTLYFEPLPGSLQSREILVCDEFHLFLKYDFAVRKLDELVRRVRKYSGSIWLSTQSLKDTYGATGELSNSIKTLFEQINTVFIGKQKNLDSQAVLQNFPYLEHINLNEIAKLGRGQFLTAIGGSDIFWLDHKLGRNADKKEKVFGGGK